MAKKILSLVLALLMIAVAFTSCSSNEEKENSSFKLGVICLHDESSTYDLNFINSVKSAAATLGLSDDQVIIKRNIPESNDCYEAAADLVDEGCSVIFADSFGHETHLLKAAKEFPDVEFCHATGTSAHTENLANFHNAFASIYEGRFLAGVAAGLKLNEMIEAGTITAEEAKMGYIGAFTYAEVISGLTATYLGAKYVCPSVTMDVQFTGSWYDETAEKNTALSLIDSGCKVISQHADSMGAPTACEEKNVPDVAYNGSTVSSCPNTFIVSSKIDWAPYFVYICQCAMNGTAIDTDWTGTIATGSVVLTDVNTTAAAEGTAEKLEEIKAKLADGSLKVFDTDTFTVTMDESNSAKNITVDENGKLTSFQPEDGVEVVKDGYVDESGFRSAPVFEIRIDGINFVNTEF